MTARGRPGTASLIVWSLLAQLLPPGCGGGGSGRGRTRAIDEEYVMPWQMPLPGLFAAPKDKGVRGEKAGQGLTITIRARNRGFRSSVHLAGAMDPLAGGPVVERGRQSQTLGGRVPPGGLAKRSATLEHHRRTAASSGSVSG